MLIRVVQAFTGMKIDHYAEVNLLGFYLLSNAIGGVPVCLNAAVDDPGPAPTSRPARRRSRAPRRWPSSGNGTACRRATSTGCAGSRRSWPGAADKILSVGTLTNPTKLNDLIDAVDRSVVFDKGFSVLTFAEQITNLSSGNINFETLPTTGPESSTDKDALATDPAAAEGLLRGDHRGHRHPAMPAARPPRPPVDPASITVDMQDGTVADGVTAYASELVNNAGFKLGSLGVVAGTKGNEQATTEFHYPADAAGAQQVAAAFGGIGKLVDDASVKSGPRAGAGGHRPAGALGAAWCGGRLRRGACACSGGGAAAGRGPRVRVVRSLCQLSEACRANGQH